MIGRWDVRTGDCLDVLAGMDQASVDAIVTDPPYGLEFMGKEWDRFTQTSAAWATRDKSEDLTGKTSSPFLAAQVNHYGAGRPYQDWCTSWATEALRVLKPGGHLLAFGGTRTWHRLAVAIEDAGFEIRDSIAWLYGSGFPKSLDVSKAIDKAAGAEREVIGPNPHSGRAPGVMGMSGANRRPAMEARMTEAGIDKTPITAPATPDAERWRGWGTALKPAFEPIVVARKPLAGTVAGNVLEHGTGALNIDACRIGTDPMPRTESDGTFHSANSSMSGHNTGRRPAGEAIERWPANVTLDETTACELDARFFYTAKAATSERVRIDGVAHPTVKPLSLIRWLIRLVTPPGGVVLDPFAGSGTTLEAAMLEGFDSIGIERESSYVPLIAARIERARSPLWESLDDREDA